MKNNSKTNNNPRHYFDWAATAIPHLCSNEWQMYGNPSSAHLEGRSAKEVLENARARCAAVLGLKAKQLYFSSGGTESNALVLFSLLLRKGTGRLLYSAMEHPSVRENCLKLKRLGVLTGEIGVEKDGRISEGCMAGALEKYPDARFITIIGVNNELGSRMDIQSLVSVIRKHQAKTGVPVHIHSDLVQALGKINLQIPFWDLDSASFSAHKLGGQPGTGLLYLKKPLESLYTGGAQEGGIRPGTENTPGALLMADILEQRAAPETVIYEEKQARERFKYFIKQVKKIKRCFLIPEDRDDEDTRFSPWIIQMRFQGVPGEVMLRALDDIGIAVSTGSACSSNTPDRPVLAAIGLHDSARREGIRISQGWSTSWADIDALLSGIKEALSVLS